MMHTKYRNEVSFNFVESEASCMKATGIVRRIDDLGRVVIPKEIRRTLRIREGDPLEIFTDRDGEVILKKVFSDIRTWTIRHKSMRKHYMKR